MFFGALASYYTSERWGRKVCMSTSIVVFMLGASMQTASMGLVGLVMAGRLIAGLGIGSAAPVIPVCVSNSSCIYSFNLIVF